MDKKIEKEFRVQENRIKEFRVQENRIKEFWNWLWHSDSFLSWIVALVFAFIIVKFIFFPLLSFLLGTSLPLVVVESGSMSHPQASFLGNTFSTASSFNNFWNQQRAWYEERSITKQEAEKFPFRTGMEKGDIIVVYGRGNIKTGDVIIFDADQQHPIIHRIVKIEQINGETIYSTKGDNNPDQLTIEKQIPENAVIGRAAFKIPKLGWLKLAFVQIFSIFK